MSKIKYKLKIAGKIVGPISRDQLDKIIASTELTGEEQYQEGSSNEWSPVSDLLSDHTLFFKLDEVEKEILKEKGEKLDFIDDVLRDQNVEFRADIKNKEEEGEDDSDNTLSKTLVIKGIGDRSESDKTMIRPLSKEEKEEFDKLKKERDEKKLQKEKKRESQVKEKKKN